MARPGNEATQNHFAKKKTEGTPDTQCSHMHLISPRCACYIASNFGVAPTQQVVETKFVQRMAMPNRQDSDRRASFIKQMLCLWAKFYKFPKMQLKGPA